VERLTRSLQPAGVGCGALGADSLTARNFCDMLNLRQFSRGRGTPKTFLFSARVLV